jgi:hypothetical protein
MFVKMSELNISAIASVATARLVPLVRTAGRATATPWLSDCSILRWGPAQAAGATDFLLGAERTR